jgi:hypothetical protein
MPRGIRKSRLFPQDVRAALLGSHYFEQPPPHNFPAHVKSHTPTVGIYTSMVPLDTTTGTDWTPSFAGRMVGIRINVLTGDEPATTATIYDLLLNANSVFASDSERPTIAVGAQHSNEEPVTRGVWIAGDSWTMRCTQTGGVNKVIVTYRFLKDH